jgi:hypothetical protein
LIPWHFVHLKKHLAFLTILFTDLGGLPWY